MKASVETLPGLPNGHLIEIPNPYSTEATNCFFISGISPTLIDTGVATDEAYKSLSESLSEIGSGIQSISRVILTHGHADHRALAPRIHRESGAEVFCHELEASKVTEVSETQETLRKSRSTAFFRSMGVPEELMPPLVETSRNPSINPRLDCVSFLNEGDRVRLGEVNLRVLHTPGHSCGSICLYEEQSGLMFTGDTLLSGSHITALLETDMIAEDPEYNGLKLHIESLQRLLGLNASYVLPGHGPVLDEYESIVTDLLERHRKRRRHIMRSLRNGPRSLYQVCRSTFIFLSADDLYLALSEVIGNLGVLIEEGQVVQHREGGLICFEKA